MKTRHLLVLSASLMFAAPAFAESGEATFAKSKCGVCHQAEKKAVGPSLKDIAAKYKGNASAQAMLEAKVRKGGAGNWGTMAMAPTPASVSDADIKAMVSWILAK